MTNNTTQTQQPKQIGESPLGLVPNYTQGINLDGLWALGADIVEAIGHKTSGKEL